MYSCIKYIKRIWYINLEEGRGASGNPPHTGPSTTISSWTTNWSTHCRAQEGLWNHACTSNMFTTGHGNHARRRKNGELWACLNSIQKHAFQCAETGHCQDRHIGTCIHYRYGLHPGRHDTSSMWMCHANPANGHRIAMYRNGYMVIHNVPTASWRG